MYIMIIDSLSCLAAALRVEQTFNMQSEIKLIFKPKFKLSVYFFCP